MNHAATHLHFISCNSVELFLFYSSFCVFLYVYTIEKYFNFVVCTDNDNKVNSDSDSEVY